MTQDQLADLVDNVDRGHTNPLKAYTILKQHKTFIEDCLNQINESVLDEARKHEKTFNEEGHDFEFRNGGKVWNYKEIPEWVAKKKELTEIETDSKAAYNAKGHYINNDGVVVQKALVTFKKDSLIIKS